MNLNNNINGFKSVEFPKNLKIALKGAKENSQTVKIIEVLVQAQLLNKDTELLWKPSFCASYTDINGIKPSDMSTSVMWGVDYWERPYVALKVYDVNEETFNLCVETIFQRDPYDAEAWAFGKYPFCVRGANSVGGANLEVDLLKKLINGEEVNYLNQSKNDHVIVKLFG